MRLPLRVTIFGSDAKEHRYLVKFGEDLRQDQRLEQLFSLMNKILDQDPTCRHRNLSIATYQVLGNMHLLLFIVASTSVVFCVWSV
jgi:DNA-dependent protein kinase catalytic subunit